MLGLDQRKAFDAVNRQFLFDALKIMGLEEEVINTLKCLYDDTKTYIQINGHISRGVELGRGVRQGCPLSPSLYAVYIQVVIDFINKQSNIRGIQLPGVTLKVSAFADDLVVFCKDEKDIEQVFKVFDNFSFAKGSFLNVNKTEMLPLSSATSITAKYQNMVVEKIKICGVIFSVTDYKEMADNNFAVKKEKAMAVLEKLKKFKLSLPGKVLLINSLVHSQLHYISGVFPLRRQQLDEVRRQCFSFLWGVGRREPIKRKWVETSKARGGLGLDKLHDICSSLFLFHGYIRPSALDFDHPRESLFKYFYGLHARKIRSDLYSIGRPHALDLHGVYGVLEKHTLELKSKLEVLGPIQVGSPQLYAWISDEKEEVPLLVDLDDQQRKRLFSLWMDGVTSALDKDFMWRLCVGALKTGSLIAKYGMPRMNTSCLFCKIELETPAHLFLKCQDLDHVRRKIIEGVIKIGCSFSQTSDRQVEEANLLFTGLCPLVESKTIRRNVFKLVSKSLSSIWMIRNERLFGPGAGDISKALGLIDFFVKDIMENLKL